MIDKSPYRKKLAKLFASGAIIGFSAIAVFNNLLVSGLVIDVNLIIFMLKLSIPAAFVLGYLGFLIGRILDNKSVRAKADRSPMSLTREDIKEAYAIDSIFSASPEDNSQLNSMFLDTQQSPEAGDVKNEI